METHYNISLVGLSYIVAVIGSFMALLVNRDALKRSEGERTALVLSIIAIDFVVILLDSAMAVVEANKRATAQQTV
jgi:NO-binding membrane sensor protein with MHYT domain